MLKRFADVLFGQGSGDVGKSEAVDSRRVPLATCVVLLEAARIDSEFTDAERGRIVESMRLRFDLSAEEASDLLDEAMDARDKSTDLWRFTHEINEAYSTAEKLEILGEVWRIFYSDGTLDGHEDHLAHKLRDLLNLNQKQLIDVKMKVLKEIRG